MIALDFFLYDNRTWSPRWGRDWGLKAATGALADRADLRAAFDKYCGAMPSGQGQLHGFGEAVGGVRSPSRDGYLLCVTLESADSFGRPSWAVFGLWCPGPVLEQVLSAGDPIGSARALLGNETPPSAIEILPAKTAVGPRWRRRASAEPVFYRFDRRSTVREVIALLVGAAQGRAAVPNVLGVTATSRLGAVAQAGFDIAYCHPLDDRAERALARVLSPQETEAEEPWPIPDDLARPPVDRQPRYPEAGAPTQVVRSEPRSFVGTLWPLWLAAGIVVFGGFFLLLSDMRRGAPASSRQPALPVEEEELASGETSVPENRSAEAVLDEVGERLRECKELVPENLRKSTGFKVAETVEVLPDYQERRIQVQQAYTALIEARDRMVKRRGNYVAYYYDEDGKGTPADTKLQRIGEILGEAPLGSEACAVLKEAFGFEFDDRSSVVRRWCDTLGRLEKTASRGLSKPPL